MTTSWDVTWAEPGLRVLATAWRDSPDRPRVSAKVEDYWDGLVAWWTASPDLPLPVRAKGTGRGSTPMVHGRKVVYVDNSPAQWIYARACDGWVPTPEELAAAIQTEMPVAQILPPQERQTAVLQRTLGQGPSTSQHGLKLHHISRVSAGGSLAKRTLPQLQEAAVRLLSPRNMFVLPMTISGLGEIQCFIDVMASATSRSS